MAKWGRADFSQLQRLEKNMSKLSRVDLELFCRACCKELAARLLALVIPKTPVGKYPKSSGKKGGTLRRGWGPENPKSAAGYAQSLAVSKVGSDYMIEIINPVEYASYVEYGHRTRNGSGWVPGRYMLTISEELLQQKSPMIIERLLEAKLKEVFNV